MSWIRGLTLTGTNPMVFRALYTVDGTINEALLTAPCQTDAIMRFLRNNPQATLMLVIVAKPRWQLIETFLNYLEHTEYGNSLN